MLSIQDRQDRLPHLARSLRRRAHKILTSLELAHAEISLLLCDDPTIQDLNREWRGIDKPTDVLSFPLEDFEQPAIFGMESDSPEVFEADADANIDAPDAEIDEDLDTDTDDNFVMPPEMLGDIIISVDTCIRQAKEYHHTPLDEATRLWVHGLLHLCGYDHETPEDASAMKQREEEILAIVSKRKITPLVSF